MRLRHLSAVSIIGVAVIAADLALATLTACGSSDSSDSPGATTEGDGGTTVVTTADGSFAPSDGGADGADGALDTGVSVLPGDSGSDASFTPVEAGVLAACPTSGAGAFVVAGTTCFNYTAVDLGEPSSGVNAIAEDYAIRPGISTAAPTQLVLFLVGSGGVPVDMIHTDPTKNVFGAAVSDGDAVISLAYSNATEVGKLCANNDACYFPTRESVILGTTEPGSALQVSLGEGIVDRLARSLRYLAASDPGGGWPTFLTTLDPATPAPTALDWSRIIVSGHSQGGGHAAAMGKLFPVERVVQLSSVCDAANGKPATWTAGSNGPWASDPTQFWGLAARTIVTDAGVSGDAICPFHAADWNNLGMVTSHQNDDAATCGNQGDTHGDSLSCGDNYPAWLALYK